MEGKYEDSVRNELRHYADAADAATRKIKHNLTDLALEIEDYSQHSAQYDLSIAEMDNSYEARKDDAGNVLYLSLIHISEPTRPY